MHAANHWGGNFEIRDDATATSTDDYDHSRNMELDRAVVHSRQQQQQHQLDETQQSWLLGPSDHPTKKKDKYVDLGCVVCKRKVIKWSLWVLVGAFFVIALPIIIAKSIPKHKEKPPPPDNYSAALKKALMFFNAQKSGKLPKSNNVSWRGDSGLQDGVVDATDVKGGLVGGYYDAGDNIKFNFPMAYSMTLLSWSVIEYSQKYRALGEYDHTRELIKWGTDYLLRTFNNSATNVDHIYSQVGTALNESTTPDDHFCWERPEDMDYKRPVQSVTTGPDLAGEMSAALASASIVFRDDPTYSDKLLKGAATLYRFARSFSKRGLYSVGNPRTAPFYNSTAYYDEYMWSAAWMYYASGNSSYLALATHPSLAKNAKALRGWLDLRVFSWDNKIPGAELLLTRLRMFLNPGFPYEDMLQSYHNQTAINMCSYLKKFSVFNYTDGGLIQLNHGRPQPLQYAANAAFLASLYTDYMATANIPGFVCGPNFIPRDELRQFATSQVDYILGNNPRKMSYLVGYGTKYPTHVHHRGASIPHDGKKYGCTEGIKWRETKSPNPNTIVGAMVGGPDAHDGFSDSRPNYNYTEPTLAGNAGLVAALVSLTSSGLTTGVDKNTIFSAVPPLYPAAPPPPTPWKP